jgi:hypothetical protein
MNPFKAVKQWIGKLETLGNSVAAVITGLISVQDTAVSTAANTTETDLFTFSLPANVLESVGRAVKIRAWGTAAATATTKRMRLYFGSTVVADTTAITLNNKTWYIEAIVTRTNAPSATNAQKAMGSYATNDGTSTTTAGLAFAKSTPAENTAAAITCKLTGQNGTANAADITAEHFEVELL